MTNDADFELCELTPDDYEGAMALWNSAPGVRASEPRAEFERILQRNPGLCLAARVQGELVGAVLCCQDGRRGYLYHLAIAQAYQRRGIGRAMVASCLEALAQEGIARCTIFLVADNHAGRSFWRETGWFERTDLVAFAHDLQV